MSVRIRSAAADDRERCLELLTMLAGEAPSGGWGDDVYDALLAKERGEIHVADEDGSILGMATVSYNLALRYRGEYCQLEELIVDPEARGKNAGVLLVRGSMECAKQRGCAEYGLYLLASTETNQPFYEKCGLVRVGSEMRLDLREPVA
jgi:GNAT superfamily N-acetyltransferase